MADEKSVMGVWKLVSFYILGAESSSRNEKFGANPRGSLILLASGHMSATITPQKQINPVTDAEKASAFGQLIAYSGKYRLEAPDRFITSVDVAWTPGWVEIEQARQYSLKGDILDIISEPTRLPGIAELIRCVLSWLREA
jgi:hypothetical protein